MMEWLALLSSIVATLALGLAGWLSMAGWPRRPAAWLLAAGEAYVLGALLIGNMLWLAGNVSTDGLFMRSLPWVLAAAALGLLWAYRRRHHLTSGSEDHGHPLQSSERRLVIGVLLLLAAVFAVIAIQAYALPTLTWDAWNAWFAKAKGWTLAGSFLPVVDVSAWLASTPDPMLSTVAAAYPEALPRFVTWQASAVGHWHDGFAHLAWPLLWVALGCSFAGMLLLNGMRKGAVALTTLFLLTLPLVTAHAALGGYADLWVAAVVLSAGHHAARFIGGDRRALLPALAFALLLPTIKMEGAVWMLLLFASVGLWMIPPRGRWALLIAAVVLVPLILLLLPSVWLPVPGLGWVVLEWGAVTVPVVGRFELFWRDVGATVVQSMLLLPNWSLLFWLLVPILVWRWPRVIAGSPGQSMLAVLLLFGAGFLFVLFFFTDAARWADDLTSLNRLLLHLVPLLVLWLVLLVEPVRPAVRGRWA